MPREHAPLGDLLRPADEDRERGHGSAAAERALKLDAIGAATEAHVDRTFGCLVEAGFSDPLADHAWNALDSYVYGFDAPRSRRVP